MRKQLLVLTAALTTAFCLTPCFGTAENPWVGVGVVNNIWLGNNNLLDTYNYDSGGKLTVRTNSTAAGAIYSRKSLINGDVVVGAGGDPAQVISNPSNVTGAMYAATQNYTYPSVMVPPNLANSVSKGSITGTMTISASEKYDSINLLTGTLTIDAPITLYVTGNISLAQLQITPNGSLVLYAGGNITGDTGFSFNSLGQDTKKLQIFGLDTCTSINWGSGGQFYGTIYAPAADFSAHFSNSFYGAVISNNFSLANNNSFYYDASLPEPATLLLLGLGGLMLRKRGI